MEIEVRNASKVINGKTILENISLTMQGGKIYGLQGPNGSGKTMLMRLVSGLIKPSSGEIYINREMLGKDIDFPRSLGLLIESPNFLPNYTGLKNLDLLAQIKGIIIKEDIWQTMQSVGLNPDDRRIFRKYSLGMRQRLGIAAAVMEHPDIIILDEPTNALDCDGVEQICKIIREEKNRGALLIISSHDLTLLELLADEIFILSDGRMIKQL